MPAVNAACPPKHSHAAAMYIKQEPTGSAHTHTVITRHYYIYYYSYRVAKMISLMSVISERQYINMRRL